MDDEGTGVVIQAPEAMSADLRVVPGGPDHPAVVSSEPPTLGTPPI